MPKRNSTVISPLPADVNRDDFGHWLSGFTDGEGHFALWCNVWGTARLPCPQARFVIALRDDDTAILRSIQSYFQCGSVCWYDRYATCKNDSKPKSNYSAAGVENLWTRIVPHFDAYPLRAKKARDFQIWKKGVALMLRVTAKDVPRRGRAGFLNKWSPEERQEFMELEAEIKEIRRWKAPDEETVSRPASHALPAVVVAQPTLFD